jgi:hypothetical protein
VIYAKEKKKNYHFNFEEKGKKTTK